MEVIKRIIKIDEFLIIIEKYKNGKIIIKVEKGE